MAVLFHEEATYVKDKRTVKNILNILVVHEKIQSIQVINIRYNPSQISITNWYNEYQLWNYLETCLL